MGEQFPEELEYSCIYTQNKSDRQEYDNSIKQGSLGLYFHVPGCRNFIIGLILLSLRGLMVL